jgi:hypothetical protein
MVVAPAALLLPVLPLPPPPEPQAASARPAATEAAILIVWRMVTLSVRRESGAEFRLLRKLVWQIEFWEASAAMSLGFG